MGIEVAIGAAIAAGTGAAGAAIAGTSILAGALIAGAGSLILSVASRALAPSPPTFGGGNDLANRGITTQVRQPITTQNVIYGEARVSGPIVRLEQTNDNEFLHICIALAGHELSDIGEIWLNETSIPVDDVGADGSVINGRFRGLVRIKRLLGTQDQLADPDLVAETSATDADRARGIAYLYVRLEFDRDVFPTGIPNISAWVKGKPIFDPRTSLTSYSPNSALIARDYLVDGRFGYDALPDEIDDVQIASAANICDEMVDVTPREFMSDTSVQDTYVKNFLGNAVVGDNPPFDIIENAAVILDGDEYNDGEFVQTGTLLQVTSNLGSSRFYAIINREFESTGEAELALATTRQDAFAGNILNFANGFGTVAEIQDGSGTQLVEPVTIEAFNFVDDSIIIEGDALFLQTGDRVTLSTDGTLPPGLLPGTNYFTVPKQRRDVLRVGLSSTFENAINGITLPITEPGVGTITVTKNAEPRYQGGGVLDSATEPRENLIDIISSMAGRAIYTGGAWNIKPGAFVTPTVSLNESNMVSGFRTTTRLSRRDRFNAVKGIYVAPFNAAQPSDYPTVTNAQLVANDNGVEILREIDLPFTQRGGAAQRIAKIELQRSRQEISVTGDFTLHAMQLRAGDTMLLSNERFGWVNKQFEVTDWRLGLRTDAGTPTPVVTMSLRETAAEVFDFNPNEETFIDPAPNTNLPSPFNISPPGRPSVTETLFVARDGGGVKVRVDLSAAPSDDQFVRQYQFRYQLGDGEFTLLPITSDPTATVFDIEPGLYTFEVRAINTLGVRSRFTGAQNIQIVGLSAPPVAITNLSVQGVSSLAVLRWDRHPDLDVRVGGRIEFRHSPVLSGATWPQSVTIGLAVAGDVTETILPLKSGTYLVRAFDSSGIQGPVSNVATIGAVFVPFTNIDTIQEDPAFPGAKDGTIVNTMPDPDVLQLDNDGLVSAITLISSVASIANFGSVRASGTYDFATGFDQGSVQTCRLETLIAATVIDPNDLISLRTNFVSTWPSVIGADVGDADAQIWVRQTDDDPNGSPVYSEYNRLDVGEFRARAFQFQARLLTSDPAYNIQVEQLRVSLDR